MQSITRYLDRSENWTIYLAALTLVAAGLTGLIFADALLQWQPVAKEFTWRREYGLISGTVLLAAGLALPYSRLRYAAALTVAFWIGSWVLFLHLPKLFDPKANLVGSLLGMAECGAIALAYLSVARPTIGNRFWQIALGLCLIMFGLSHFAYAEFTASMVPGWIPAKLAVAYLTGIVHAVTGLAILLGWHVRIAAAVEAAMMASFVLLLHLPRVFAAPDSRTEITMLVIALLLTASMAIVASRAAGDVLE